jgi:hypothetical protein
MSPGLRGSPATVGSGVNVPPVRVLEGHKGGAVFDVRRCGGEMISAGEDGAVGVWSVDEEDGED